MLEFSMTVKNAPEVRLFLGGLAANVQDLTPIWPGFVEYGLRPIIAGQFASRGAEGEHGPWAPLSPAYLERKFHDVGAEPILVRSHRMIDSLLTDTDDTVKNMMPQALQFGTVVEYAGFHQTGTGKMPARRLFDFTEPQRKEMVTALQRELMAYFQRLGYKLLGRNATPAEARHAGATASSYRG
jgi:phage gpG-like protein